MRDTAAKVSYLIANKIASTLKPYSVCEEMRQKLCVLTHTSVWQETLWQKGFQRLLEMWTRDLWTKVSNLLHFQLQLMRARTLRMLLGWPYSSILINTATANYFQLSHRSAGLGRHGLGSRWQPGNRRRTIYLVTWLVTKCQPCFVFDFVSLHSFTCSFTAGLLVAVVCYCCRKTHLSFIKLITSYYITQRDHSNQQLPFYKDSLHHCVPAWWQLGSGDHTTSLQTP